MTGQPLSPYPAIVLTHLRALDEHKTEFTRSIEVFARQGVAELFERYPEVTALAYDICGNSESTEVHGDLAGVIVAGARDDAHPANREAKRLVDALALAEEAVWSHDDNLDLAVLARRCDTQIETTVHDPSDDCASALLDLVVAGEPIPPGYTPRPDDDAGVPASRFVLSIDDVEVLAEGHSTNVVAGPRNEEIIIHGDDFDEDAIAALERGETCEVDGFVFAALQPLVGGGGRTTPTSDRPACRSRTTPAPPRPTWACGRLS
jgi:hypothetical protein